LSVFDRNQLLDLVPFSYTLRSRVRSPIDFAFLVLSSWLPAIWFALRVTDDPGRALTGFAFGYLAFIAVYEIGYVANDAWDAVRSSDGRQRLAYRPTATFLALFASIRLALWAAVGIITGWVGDPLWLAAFGALIAAFAMHNLIRSSALRSASFLQLAVLRFSLPVLAITPRTDIPTLLIIALLLYAYLRFLSYLDSKGLLNMHERRQASFGALQIAILTPFLLLVALLLDRFVIAELTVYFLIVYGGWWMFGQRRSSKVQG
jgi:hypothetical protein